MVKKGKSKTSKAASTKTARTSSTAPEEIKADEVLPNKGTKPWVLISTILTALLAIGVGVAFKNGLFESLPSLSLSSPNSTNNNNNNILTEKDTIQQQQQMSSDNDKDPNKPNTKPSNSYPLDAAALPKKSSEVMASLAKAADNSDIITAQTLTGVVLESYNPTYMWKAAEQFHRSKEPQMLALRLELLRAAYDFIFGIKESVVTHPQTGRMMVRKHGELDKRRITQLLGEAYENDGNKDDAYDLYQDAIDEKLWLLPDQRPQHFFPFIKPGLPFPHTSTYQEAVDMLESNFEAMRKELLMQQQFPGQLKMDTEKLSVSGDWLQAEFLHQGRWHTKNVQTFPTTANVLRTMAHKFAYQLPDAVMQMSTLSDGTEVRPHCGSGNHKVRLHLALVVPDTGVGIKVANETNVWETGKVLIIDDSYVHSVWNKSSKFRTVLIVDVWADGISELEKEQVRNYFRDRNAKLRAQHVNKNQ